MKHTAIALLLLGFLVEASSYAAVRELAARSYNNNRHDVDSDDYYEEKEQYNPPKNENQNYNANSNYTNVQNNIKVENRNQDKYEKNDNYDNNEYQAEYKPRPRKVARQYAYENGGYSSHATGYGYSDPYQRISLIPMVGGSWFASRWGDHISNSYSFGLALDIPWTNYISSEIEASYGKYWITYGAAPGVGWKHDFNQFTLGSNLKVYLVRSWIRPYLGVGLMAVDYDGMTRGPRFPLAPRYNQWIGSAQFIAGTDFTVTDGIALGVRGAYLMPVFNRPYTVDNGVTAAPGFEEAAAINTSYYKLMATVKISL